MVSKRMTTIYLSMMLLVVLIVPAIAAAQDATEEPVAATEEAMAEEPAATEEAMAEEPVAATEEAMAEEPATTEEAVVDDSEEEAASEEVTITATTSTVCPPDDSPSVEYRVQPGDTLSSIARAYGVSAVCLARFNDIVNPSLIFWGSLIDIPTDEDGGTGGPTPPDGGNGNLTTYTVRQGDNLYRISLRFETTISRLQNLNPTVTNPNVIYVGQELIVPATE